MKSLSILTTLLLITGSHWVPGAKASADEMPVDPNSKVLTLTTDTFESALKDNSLLMVEFYAPCTQYSLNTFSDASCRVWTL